MALLFATLGFGVAGIGYVVHRVNHLGEGPRHTFSLAGEDPLTDEQAIAFAKQTLQLDGRFSQACTLATFADGRAVNRGDDKQFASVGWWDPERGQWYVQLRRSPGRVEAVSYPGK